MGHLACVDHKRRVLVIKEEEEVPFAVHREDGSYCRATTGFKLGNVDYKSGYDVINRDPSEPTKKRRRKRKHKSSGEKLLEEIFTEPAETGIDFTEIMHHVDDPNDEKV